MAKTSEETLKELMEVRGINRKSAVQFLRRQAKKAVVVTPSATLATFEKPAAAPESRAHVATLELETLPPAQSVAPIRQPDELNARLEELGDKAPHIAAAKQRKVRKDFDTAKAIAFYQQGIAVPKIAEFLGYKPGQGQNRTRTALRAAGVYKEKK